MNDEAAREPLPVKICGITNRADAEAAVEAGASALGFNLYPGSKRYIPLEEIAGWLADFPATRVSVMVNPTMEEARQAQEIFDVVQLHGDESAEFCRELAAHGPVWKAVALRAGLDLPALATIEAEALLIDAFVPGLFGGTGQLIDLDRAADFIARCEARRVWLSGGLTPENVGDAVRSTSPYGVDVASGVESEGDPRRKDPAKIRAFIEAARGG